MILSFEAASAGMATTSLTYYYRHKEDLAMDCFDNSFPELDQIIKRAELESTPEGRLHSLIMGYYNLQCDIVDQKRIPLLHFGLILALTGKAANIVFSNYTNYFRSVRSLFQPEQFDNTYRSQLNARTLLLISQMSWSAFLAP